MKTSAILVTVAAAAVSAQAPAACEITSIPSCALPSIQGAIGSATSCSVTDFVCVCQNQDALTQAATPGVLTACGADTALSE
jgi:hypothetical protein